MKSEFNEWDMSKTMSHLASQEVLSLDTETYGLGWDDRLFSLIIADERNEYYFNFNPNGPMTDKDTTFYHLFHQVFKDPRKTWIMHNAKFDLRRLALEHAYIAGDIHDTEVTARLLRNDHMEYSLKAVAYRYGFTKSDAVEKYIKEHKLYEARSIPGKSKRETFKFFDKVPFEIMCEYGCIDARITYDIGKRQMDELST